MRRPGTPTLAGSCPSAASGPAKRPADSAKQPRRSAPRWHAAKRPCAALAVCYPGAIRTRDGPSPGPVQRSTGSEKGEPRQWFTGGAHGGAKRSRTADLLNAMSHLRDFWQFYGFGRFRRVRARRGSLVVRWVHLQLEGRVLDGVPATGGKQSHPALTSCSA